MKKRINKNSIKKRKGFSLNDFIYSNFKASLKYLKETKNYIWFSLLLFFSIAVVGFLFPIFFPEEILRLIKELIDQTQGLDLFGMIRFIFINNLKSSFFAIFCGILFGIIPFAILIVNGYVLGFVANKTTVLAGYSVLWRLLPHGIFELPAVLISIGIGIAFGIRFLSKIHKLYFKNLLPLYLFFILCILFLPLTLMMILILFLFFLYYSYVLYYIDKKKYIFLVLSILIFPIMIFNIVFNNKLRTILNEDFSDNFKVFVFIVIPLLIIASIIEGALIIFLG